MPDHRMQMCCICREYPVSQRKSVVCKSPKCKRMLADERRRVDLEKISIGQASSKRIREMRKRIDNPLHNQTLARNRVDELMNKGFSEVEAISRTAEQYKMKPAEVLYACRSTKT
jgi:hypothetical protein